MTSRSIPFPALPTLSAFAPSLAFLLHRPALRRDRLPTLSAFAPSLALREGKTRRSVLRLSKDGETRLRRT